MISDADKQKVRTLVDAEVASFIRTIPNQVQTILHGAMLSLLGLERDGSMRYRVDHCNGRRGVLIELVESAARDALTKLIPGLVAEAIAELAADEKVVKALAREVHSIYHRGLERALDEQAREYAKHQATIAMLGLVSTDLGSIVPTNTDIQDPNSFGGEVGALILAEIAKAQAAGKQVRVERVQSGDREVAVMTRG